MSVIYITGSFYYHQKDSSWMSVTWKEKWIWCKRTSNVFCDFFFPFEVLVLIQALYWWEINFLKVSLFFFKSLDYNIFFVKKHLCVCSSSFPPKKPISIRFTEVFPFDSIACWKFLVLNSFSALECKMC